MDYLYFVLRSDAVTQARVHPSAAEDLTETLDDLDEALGITALLALSDAGRENAIRELEQNTHSDAEVTRGPDAR